MKITKFILILIFTLGSFLRFYNLGKIPDGLNLDEVAIGYNAYSILKTGHDEYGKFLPIVFRSHDDYKPPLYIYLTVPSVAVFGLNEFAVRFPSALLGSLAILSTFLLTKELFPKKTKVALLASLMLAISPWHLQFTRVAFETGSTVFFTSVGVFLFLKGRKNSKYLIYSALVFGLELYLYQVTKVVVPILLFALCASYFKEIIFKRKIALVSLGIFLFFFIPTVFISTTKAGITRLQGTSIYLDPKPQIEYDSWRNSDQTSSQQFSLLIFHPRVTAYLSEIIYGYLSHFRTDILFLGRNGPPVNYSPGVGLLYLWEILFIPLGLFFLYRNNDRKSAWIITIWLLISPLPASLTTGVPSAIRTAIILPTFSILTALGIYFFYSQFKHYSRWIFTFLNIFLLAYFLSFYLHQTWYHSMNSYSKTWYFGYKQMINDVILLAPKYKNVIVSPKIGQPQNFFAFYLKYDPKTYIYTDGGTVSGGFEETRNHFGKYFFQTFNDQVIRNSPDALFVGKPDEFPGWAEPIYKYRFLNGEESVVVYGRYR